MLLRAAFVTASAFAFALPAVAADFIVSAFDSIALPGERAAIHAKVENDDIIRGNASREPVTFTLGEEQSGTVRTAGEGLATLSVTAPTVPGIYQFEATARDGSSSHGRLVVVPSTERLFVTDIDETISDLPTYLVPFTDNRRIPAMDGSLETLHALDEDRTIVYLTARDDRLLNKTRAWLELRGFPEGLLIVSDLNLDGISTDAQGRYKLAVIEELQAKWPRTDAGVGDKQHDSWAYLSADMRAYTVGERYQGAVSADWYEIKDLEQSQD